MFDLGKILLHNITNNFRILLDLDYVAMGGTNSCLEEFQV